MILAYDVMQVFGAVMRARSPQRAFQGWGLYSIHLALVIFYHSFIPRGTKG